MGDDDRGLADAGRGEARAGGDDPTTAPAGRIGVVHGLPEAWTTVGVRRADPAETAQLHLAAVVASSDDAILSGTLDGTNLSWNAGAERLFGYRAEEMVGHNVGVLVPADRRDEANTILHRVLAGERVTGFETVRIHKDGHLVPVALTVSPMRDTYGQFFAVSVIARDITERKRVEAELRSALARSTKVEQLKTEFLRTVSHEMRTPMHGVIGMTSLLLDTALDGRQREYAEGVRASAEQLLSIVEDVLAFSTLVAGRVELHPCALSVRAEVEDVATRLGDRARERSVRLRTAVSGDVPDVVLGPAEQLRRVLTEVVENAVSFTEAGEVDVRVDVEREGHDSLLVRFEVSDTGIGIPADASRIFDPFSQADPSSTRRYGGMGLGLAIAERLVALMGGVMSARREPGRGSTFCFTVELGRDPGTELGNPGS